MTGAVRSAVVVLSSSDDMAVDGFMGDPYCFGRSAVRGVPWERVPLERCR